MDSYVAFMKGEVNRGKELRVFDWIEAAKIIKKRGVTDASAGLSEDWNWTGGEILKNGTPVPQEDTYTYLASTWATPTLDIGGESIPCFRMQSQTPKWDARTFWPEEAKKILLG